MVTRTQLEMLWSALLVTLIAHACVADVQEFFDFEAWQNAAGDSTFIGFTEYPQGTFISDQYADLGIVFPEGNASILNSNSFEDGHGIWFDGSSGFDNIWVEFDEPTNAIGAQFPGGLQIEMFANGESLNEPDSFSGGFLGYVSDQPFDSAILVDPTGVTAIDNIYFAPPIPAPGALGVFPIAALCFHRRRRR